MWSRRLLRLRRPATWRLHGLSWIAFFLPAVARECGSPCRRWIRPSILPARSAAFVSGRGGELTTDEGSAVAGLIEPKRKAIETVELEARLIALEHAAQFESGK